MQCFKLVNTGDVDKVIVFDKLPERLLTGIRTRQVTGFPRTWAKWLSMIGCTRPVMKTETSKNVDNSGYSFKYTPIGSEPCFYILEYQDVNADKEKWRAISEFVRMNAGPEVRLKEKLESMAIALADNCKDPLSVEPEEVPVIPLPEEVEATVSNDAIVQPDEQVLAEEFIAPKRRGRPKKEVAA